MPTSQQTDQPCAGFVFLVDKWRLCDTFRVRLTNEVEEMNRQELIDEAIRDNDGLWPSDKGSVLNVAGSGNLSHHPYVSLDFSAKYEQNDVFWVTLCNKAEFEQRASELGYINGYRWGVEYQTNGEEPDLPGDVLVYVKFAGRRNFHHVGCAVNNWPFDQTSHFKIVDDKYKPADRGYLDAVSEIPESKLNAENVSDWYDYEAQRAVALPPVAIEVIAKVNKEFNCYFVGKNSLGSLVIEKADGELICYHSGQITFKPLDHNRKAEAEKKRVVDTVQNAINNFDSSYVSDELLSFLFEAGFLRMPAE